MRRLLLIIGIVSCCAVSGCVAQALTSGRVEISNDSVAAMPEFSARDRELIHDYYVEHRRAGTLEHQRRTVGEKLERGERIPADIERRALPAELERRLTPLPALYRRAIIGADVVLFNRRTRVVVDIVRGIAA